MCKIRIQHSFILLFLSSFSLCCCCCCCCAFPHITDIPLTCFAATSQSHQSRLHSHRALPPPNRTNYAAMQVLASWVASHLQCICACACLFVHIVPALTCLWLHEHAFCVRNYNDFMALSFRKKCLLKYASDMNKSLTYFNYIFTSIKVFPWV